MDTLCPQTRPALQRFYRVAGHFLLVEAPDNWSAGVFAGYFEGLYSTAEGAGTSANPDAIIRIESALSQPQTPPGFLRFELPGDGSCDTDGATIYIRFGDSLVLLEGDGSACVRVWFDGLREIGSPTLTSVVSYAVSAALRRSGLVELHSGGVCDPAGGKGALIVGASGSGKSTLTLQLAASGWGYLSDDVLLLREGEDRVEAWGLRRDFAVTEETLAASRLPELRDGTGVGAAYNLYKRRLAPAVLFPARHVESCAPSKLLFPVVTGEPISRVEELTRAEAMARLIRMCPWASYDTCAAEGSLRLLAHLSRQCSAHAIYAGRDLLDAPHLANEIILPLM